MGPDMTPDDDAPLIGARTFRLIVLSVIAVAAVGIALSVRSQRRHDAAEEQVFAWCQRLDAEKDATTKRWKRWPTAELPESDPWGHPLRVRYTDGTFGEKLTVSSDGPDRKQWTRDDLEWSASNVEWLAVAKEGAGAVEEVAGAASRGIVGGVIEGVTDHLPKDVRDRLGIPSERDKPAEAPPKGGAGR